MLTIQCTKTHPNAIIPKKTNGNLGFDLHIICDKDFFKINPPGIDGKYKYQLVPREKKLFSTGIIIEPPEGYGVLLRDRSGLAAAHGIHILAGVIDYNYRGEIKICAINLGSDIYEFHEGDRIAQGILIPEYDLEFVQTDYLTETNRGEKGFGSSGR